MSKANPVLNSDGNSLITIHVTVLLFLAVNMNLYVIPLFVFYK